MITSVQERTRIYILIDTMLSRVNPLSEGDKRQLEVLRDEMGEEIVAAVRGETQDRDRDEDTSERKKVA